MREQNDCKSKIPIEFSTPEDRLLNLYRRIPRYIKLTFTSAVILGILVHLYIFSNKLPNHDDIGQLFGSPYGNASGRWLLPELLKIDGSFSMPWLIGVLSVILLAISACFTVNLFRIHRPLGCVLTSAILITFPTVASTFTYMFSADAYFLSLVLACSAVYVTNQYRFGFIGGIAAIIFSMGIYQSFFGVTAVMMVGVLILENLDGKKPFKLLMGKALIFVVTLSLGIIGYMITVKLTTRQIELVDYMGISHMGSISLSQLSQQIKSAYWAYYDFFIANSSLAQFSYLKYAFVLTAAATMGLCLYIIREKNLSIKNIVLLALLTAIYPLAGSVIYIMVPNAPVHLLMIYGMCYILIVPLSLEQYYIELINEKGTAAKSNWWLNLRTACCWIIAGTMAVTAYSYAVYDNTAYLKMQLCYEQSYAYSIRLLSAIEDTEGYEENIPIILVGEALNKVEFKPSPELDEIQMTGVMDMKGLINSYTYGYFLRRFVGMSNIVYDTETSLSEKYKAFNQIKQMPNYPAPGSISSVDEYIIVKFS